MKRRFVAIVVVLATVPGACHAVVSPSSTPTPEISAAASTPVPTVTASSTASTSSTLPSLSPWLTPVLPTSTPRSTAKPTPAPTVSPIPTGAWKSLRWIEIDHIFPCESSDPVNQPCGPGDGLGALGLFGYSRGYLAFAPAGPDLDSTQMEVRQSADGVNWRRGSNVVVNGGIVQVVEGPTGLIAVARDGTRGLCGTYPTWITGLALSTDGLRWSVLNMVSAFGSSFVYDISGGPSGYIADGVAQDLVTPLVWVSRDGRTWRSVELPAEVLAAAEPDNPTSFSGGFEIATEDFKGCGDIPLLTKSTWFSTDGTTWIRSDFPGYTASIALNATLYRTSPSSLLAVCPTETGTRPTKGTQYWISGDGMTWKQLPGPTLAGETSGVFAFGNRFLVVSWKDSGGDTPVNPQLLTLNPGATSLTTLNQSGSAPQIQPVPGGGGVGFVPEPNMAMGPSGLLVTDGSGVWFGVPAS